MANVKRVSAEATLLRLAVTLGGSLVSQPSKPASPCLSGQDIGRDVVSCVAGVNAIGLERPVESAGLILHVLVAHRCTCLLVSDI